MEPNFARWLTYTIVFSLKPIKPHSFASFVLMVVDFYDATEVVIDADIECSKSSTFKSDDYFFLWKKYH
jgi:hypothetical protein